MIALIFVILAGLATWWAINYFHRYGSEDISSPKTSDRLNKLWVYVDKAFKSGRFRAMEKALLAILRVDHKNTAAYNRLGMLYARSGNYPDAIDCFSIASSLTPTVATLYNLGLVHYEVGNYREAAHAFERVVDLEPDVKRYIAYAKASSKIGNHRRVVEVLERVVELEPTAEHWEMLAAAYAQNKNYRKAEEARRQVVILGAKKIKAAKAQDRSRLAKNAS